MNASFLESQLSPEGSDAGAPGWAGLGWLAQHPTPGRQNDLFPEREWLAAGSGPLPQPALRESHSPDVFQTDIPTGARPGNPQESRPPPSLSQRRPLAIAQGLVATDLSCSGDPSLPPCLTFCFPSEGLRWSSWTTPCQGKLSSHASPLRGLRRSCPTHHASCE